MPGASGSLRATARRAPVAVAIVVGILLAGSPVDATSGWSDWSAALLTGSAAEAAAGTAPGAPPGLVASCASRSKGAVQLSWGRVAHATAYTVSASETGSPGYTAVATVTASAWTGTLAKGTYRFEVSASAGGDWAGPSSGPTGAIEINAGGHCR